MKRRSALAALGGGATLATAGCLGGLLGSGCSADDHHVGMTASAFEPRDLTVDVGTTVLWRNTSNRAHTVTAYPEIPEEAEFFSTGEFDSTEAAREGWKDQEGALYTCETYEHTFEVPGEYGYFCIPHERGGMVGTVTVEE